MNIITSELATELVVRFPRSAHRSPRIHKKLTRRFGDQEYRRPAAYVMGGRMYAHPTIVDQLKRDLAVKSASEIERLGSMRGML